MMKLKKYKSQQGFSLIELILVLGLSSLAFISLVQWEVKKSEIARAEIAGEQFAEVGKALSAYIAKEQLNLATNIAVGTTATMDIEVLKGTNSGAFIGHQYLPTNFSAVNIFGTAYQIEVGRTATGRIEGVVLSVDPICEKGTSLACPDPTNPIKYDWIGAAMRKMGAQSGMVRDNGVGVNVLYGFNAGWNVASTDFPTVITAPGQIGFRVSSTDTSLYDAQYLRLDGTSTMLGNLNMGNYSIENATNISYNGWLQGYGVLANTIRSGSINNTGDIQTTNLYATGIIKAGAAALPTVLNDADDLIEGGDIIADRNVYARDIYLGADINHANRTENVGLNRRTIPNVWLSDLLPKYVSRGIYNISDSGNIAVANPGGNVTKPVCNGGGTPRIEVIPQFTYSHGRVLGDNNLTFTQTTPSDWSAYLDWDLAAYSPVLAYANDLGAIWNVRIVTSRYEATVAGLPTPTMVGLAHVYCDYSF
jgi:prepilin-type N-terminal cleavage/methylation domain-containing protein